MLTRAFIIAITVAAIWWPLRSFGLGLGLGDAIVESSLSSPLRVDIPLRGMEGISLDPEKFSIVIEDASRPNMEYRLERIDEDTATIVLYTRHMVTEPLVHFRLKVKWDKSAIARSYDVFIDPPSYQFATPDEVVTTKITEVTPVEASIPVAKEISEPVLQPVATDSTVTVTEVEPESDTGIIESETVTSEFSGEVPEQRREYGPTIDGNSIWRVARAVSTDDKDLTIYQWMYGIWKANPQAFTRSNMHRLNMEELLSIPLEREIAETSHSLAWRAYSSQMTMLQPSAKTREVTADDVPGTNTVAEVSPGIADEVIPVNGSSITTPDESTRGDLQETEVTAIDEPTIAVIENMDEGAMNAATIANLEEIEASIDIEEVEASIVTGSLSSADAEVFDSTDVILDLLEDAGAGNEADATTEQSVSTGAVPLAATTGEIESQATAAGSLESRGEFVAQLPIIGSGAPLAFIGRAWQRADEFISSSPSWAAMAFGGWIVLVLLMLIQEFRARRRVVTAEMKISSDPAPLSMQAAFQDPKLAATTVVVDESPVEDELEIKAEQGNLGEPENSPIEPESSEAAVAAESKQPRVMRGTDRRASERRVTARPTQPDRINFNSDEILEKANTFIASGNSGEAVKLLELTVKLQPDRLNLVLRLLEIYHKLKNPEAFEILVQRFKPALEVMEISKQIDLQVMYSKLCPDSPPLMDPDRATDLDDTDVGLHDEDEAAGEFDNEMGEFLDDQVDHFDEAVDEEEYVATQVIVFNNGALLDEDVSAASGMVGEAIDPEVTLEEVDVYLAYGLYESAEELLLKGMAACPGRVDFLARLLDSYYATKNVVDFEIEAEVIHSLGEVADPYWEKIVIMGYELAPYNEMFAEGKDKSLGVFELETVRPELPDFDLGAMADASGLSSTDVDLLADVTDAESDEITLDDDETDLTLNEAEIALDVDDLTLDVDDLTLDVDEVALTDDDVDLDISEIALNDDDEIIFDEAEVAIDDDDTDLTDADIAAAFTETNLNLDAEIRALGNLASKSTGNDDTAVIDDDEAGRVESEENASLMNELPENDLHDGDDEVVLELDDDEEFMKFTIPGESDPEQPDSSVSVDDGGSAAVKISAENDDEALAPLDSRILYFPDTGNDKVKSEQFEEFASEVRMTLQAIRDQLQNMTERQYRQERETHELHKSIAEMSGDSAASGRKHNKKSS